MAVVGVIAEFNPLHNGHVELLNYAKNVLHASHTLVIMSGDFTQRGNPAMVSKYDRAKIALRHGADLVIEMPTVAATSSAGLFAACGISQLAATGVVGSLLFGSENADLNTFRVAANIAGSDTMDYHKQINEFVRQGDNYAVARQKAIAMQKQSNSIPPDFLSQPNNILGVEYVKVLAQGAYDIEPICVPRIGSEHNSTSIKGSTASGSAIRQAFDTNQSQNAQPTVPEDVMKLLRFNAQFKTLVRSSDMSMFLHYKLLTETDFSNYLDCNEDISNKINNMKNRFVEFENFCSLLKSKDLTHARISRILTHIVLGITEDDLGMLKACNYAPYLRILGFSGQGTSLLAEIKANAKAPFFLAPQDGMPQLNDTQKALLQRDVYASDLYRALLTNKSGRIFQTEYTRRFELKDITEG